MDASQAIAAELKLVPAAHAGGPTDPAHDARLRRGEIDTAISRRTAALLSAAFLLLIYGIPLSQALLERIDEEDSTLLEIFRRAPTKDNLHEFERELDQASYAKSFVQPRAQLLLSRLGRVGNKRAVIGQQGWLYYTPGLTHLAGPSFIAADVIRMRQREALQADGDALHPDPRPAIFAMHAMLARRGIKLVLFPVPDKTMLQPMQLHGRVDARRPIPVAHGAGWNEFAAQLRAHGVALFDPAPSVLGADGYRAGASRRRVDQAEAPRFLVQDTHWTPAWMERVAADLARFVRGVTSLAPSSARPLHAVAQRAERVGDLVDMLKLPEGQSLFRPQAVTIHQVQDESGAPWQPDDGADVLLLGDSFTNVFSMDTMGWGESAGLAPQLALALGRGVDVIAQNDSGAFATRQALSRALSAGEDRLAGKRVVIWEFASRELSVGDWKPIDWNARGAAGAD